MRSVLCLLALLGLWTQSVSAGLACFPACTVACCEAGVFAFANPLGIAIGVTGCTGVCMVACAQALFIPPACLSNATTIHVLQGKTVVARSIGDISQGEAVLTLGEDSQRTWTTVVRNEAQVGSHLDFFEFTIATGSSMMKLQVTPNHGMLTARSSSQSHETMVVTLPKDLSRGDRVMTNEGIGVIANIRKFEDVVQHNLVTASGDVLASGVLVTTVCTENVTSGIAWSGFQNDWKNLHRYREISASR